MKNLALAALSLAAGTLAPVAANAAIFHSNSTVAGDAAATPSQQTGSYAQKAPQHPKASSESRVSPGLLLLKQAVAEPRGAAG